MIEVKKQKVEPYFIKNSYPNSQADLLISTYKELLAIEVNLDGLKENITNYISPYILELILSRVRALQKNDGRAIIP